MKTAGRCLRFERHAAHMLVAASQDWSDMQLASSYLTTKLMTFMPLTDPERLRLEELQSSPIHLKRGQELLHQGEKGSVGYVLHSGWGCSFKIMRDGGRQIITFPVPGDCIGMRSLLLRTSDHTFSALTNALVSRIEADRMLSVLDDYPRLAAAILWSVSRDEAITVDHLANMGQRDSLERTAHFFLELADRLRLVGLVKDNQFSCPLSQNDIADALGLSAVHINRVLRKLRESKLMLFTDHSVQILDGKGMKALAGYEDVD
jgi:CRP-like cAMP-binding protein